MVTLCEKMGGEAAIASVVHKFYEIMYADPRVNEFFKNSDIDKQRKMMTAFITMATGGPNHYEGRDMKTIHAKMNIGQAEFDATWENMQKSCEIHKCDPEHVKELKTIVYSLSGDIITKK